MTDMCSGSGHRTSFSDKKVRMVRTWGDVSGWKCPECGYKGKVIFWNPEHHDSIECQVCFTTFPAYVKEN